jgi:hypothetical protein
MPLGLIIRSVGRPRDRQEQRALPLNRFLLWIGLGGFPIYWGLIKADSQSPLI